LRNILLAAILFLSPQSPTQFPPLGSIDFYGLHKVSEAQVRQALSFHEGDTIDTAQFHQKKQDAEQKLAAIPGVQNAFLTLVCCTEGQKSMLYVGIQETGTSCSAFQPAPVGTVRLPEDIVRAGKDLDSAGEKAMRKGDFGEDDSQGHALGHDPDLHAVQLRFVTLAEAHTANLKDVLQNSSDAEQRALAAEVLGYVKEKQSVVPNLVAAMRDPSPDVRNNATRALLVFTRYSAEPPSRRIRVSPQPFIEMLNSCVWTDRNKSSAALAELTEQRDPALLAEIREQALHSLVEMANWKWLGHATNALMILGRMGGMSDEQIQQDLESGKRERVIAAAEANKPGK
jgi:hypothetical protein